MNTPAPDWALLFDVDGTMVDNAAYHERAWIELGRRRNLPITAAFYRQHIHSRSNDIIVRTLYNEEVSPAFIQEIEDEKEIIYREMYRPVAKENPGLTPLLEDLRNAGIPCAAASNSPLPNVLMVLDALNIASHFPVVVAQGPDMPGKPAPDIFLTAARKLGVPIHRCLILEDSISGFRAAETAGAPYMVISGGADAECLKQAHTALAVYPDFTALSAEILRQHLESA